MRREPQVVMKYFEERDMRLSRVWWWVGLLGLGGSQVADHLPAADRPNIVMIIADDQGWTDYGFMGHPRIQTPALDRLARESVLFRRGYVPTALCRPSLMTLVTGHYAYEHGVTGNDPSPKYAEVGSELYRERCAALIRKIDRLATLPKQLGALGYWSHQSGKWWEGGYQRGGFTHGMTRGFPQPGGRHGDDGLRIGREGLQPIAEFVDSAVAADRPFFVWYAPFLPHTPHNPPDRFLKKYANLAGAEEAAKAAHNKRLNDKQNGMPRRTKQQQPDSEKERKSQADPSGTRRAADGLPLPVAKYFAMCEWFDETCGQLLDILESKQLRDNTIVVYVTDNGWIQDPQGSGYAPRSKQTPYEGGIRTPIMLCWPNRWKPADRADLVSSIDLVPTLLAAAGATSANELPGLNLGPYLDRGEPLPRETLFGESFAHDIAQIDNPEATLLYRWCIDGPWKLMLTYNGEVNRYASTHPRAERRPQLFQLLDDPHERNNVAAQHPERVAAMVQKIEAWYPVTNRQVIKTWQE
jgi:arylsulfatase A-like enzyme